MQLERVRERIRQACQRSGRDPSSVTLVCVTKGISPEAIQQAIALGVTDIGENRVQEAKAKQAVLGSLNLEPVRWHLIGHLQRNKAKLAVELFDVIHSVDSLELIEELDRQAGKQVQGSGFGARGTYPEPRAPSPERLLEVFIQVNVSGEATKSGCRPEEVTALAQALLRVERLKLRGLMTIAPFVEEPERTRPCFRQLRMLRDELQAQLFNPSPITHHPSLLLSMGMSQDFEVAIEEGADFIRIGSAIFQ